MVNAGDDAIAAHATSPEALQAFFDRGVRLVSSSNLHAKVLATRTTAVVGSANASRNSQQSSEAVIVTDQRSVLEDVKAFVKKEIRGGKEINELFIKRARKIRDASPHVPRINIPGVTGQPPADTRNLPDPLTELFLEGEEPIEFSDDAKRLERDRRARVRSALGPDSKFGFYAWLYDGKVPYRNGDVLILIRTAGNNRVSVRPPAVVEDVALVPRRKRQYLVTLRYRSEDKTLSRKDVLAELAQAGLPDFELEDDGRKITDTNELAALRGLWRL
ncbi:hypothetical protein [Williamsia sp.]|uniref:hypothetical protein n=1 Tax=Williamsia sp. TaxID=1872085 RepID=UPI002F951E32